MISVVYAKPYALLRVGMKRSTAKVHLTAAEAARMNRTYEELDRQCRLVPVGEKYHTDAILHAVIFGAAIPSE